MKRIICTIFLFVITIIFSCSNNAITEPKNNGYILPLNVGNKWSYKGFVYQKNTNDSVLVLIDSTNVTMEVTHKDSLGNFKGYKIKNLIIGLIDPMDHMVLNNDFDGLYIAIVSLASIPLPPPSIGRAFKYPTIKNDRNEFWGYTIVTKSISENITVNSSSFNCILYDVYINEEIVAQFWVAIDIGIIKTWQSFGFTKYVLELDSYELNDN